MQIAAGVAVGVPTPVTCAVRTLYLFGAPNCWMYMCPAGNYTTDRLREIFSAHCSVEDVILKDSRKKKKASALVVLSSTAEAEHAEQQVHGDLNNPLLVTPYLKVMPGVPQQQQQQQQPHGTFTTAAAAGSGSGRSTAPLAAAAGQPSAAGQQPLFATGLAGATSRPVQRPGKPLFPGKEGTWQQCNRSLLASHTYSWRPPPWAACCLNSMEAAARTYVPFVGGRCGEARPRRLEWERWYVAYIQRLKPHRGPCWRMPNWVQHPDS